MRLREGSRSSGAGAPPAAKSAGQLTAADLTDSPQSEDALPEARTAVALMRQGPLQASRFN
eukprot:11194302-Lingulodinium_polyedra.AAC.1